MGRPVHRPDPIAKGAPVIFEPGGLSGVVVVSPDRHVDDRGFFARTWCAREFAAAGLPSTLAQCSVSWNERRYTMRGMHWEARPQRESKLVRCTRGAIFDVVVDLRPESPSYLRYMGLSLTADDHRAEAAAAWDERAGICQPGARAGGVRDRGQPRWGGG